MVSFSLRPFLFACLLLLIGTAVQAQPSLRYGFSGGLALASQSPGEDSRSGFNVGFFGEVVVLPYLAVNADLSYVQKGQSFRDSLGIAGPDTTLLDPGTFTIALDYASLALTAKPFLLFGERGAGVYAVLGPRIDVLLREKLLFSGEQEDGVTITTERNESLVLGYDAGVGVRLGTVLPVQVFTEVRFSGDLSEVLKEVPGVENRVLQFRLGVDF